jgi:hypothetical protein
VPDEIRRIDYSYVAVPDKPESIPSHALQACRPP